MLLFFNIKICLDYLKLDFVSSYQSNSVGNLSKKSVKLAGIYFHHLVYCHV